METARTAGRRTTRYWRGWRSTGWSCGRDRHTGHLVGGQPAPGRPSAGGVRHAAGGGRWKQPGRLGGEPRGTGTAGGAPGGLAVVIDTPGTWSAGNRLSAGPPRTESGTPHEAAGGSSPDGWEANHAVLARLAEHRVVWRP